MRVLLTGASSFTGCWFAEALAQHGASVLATTRRQLAAYPPAERARLAKVRTAGVELVPGAAFGDAQFLAILREEGPFDLLAYHGCEVGDFRRPDYDPLAALESNAREAAAVADALAAGGGKGVIVTGSIFEPDEGAGCERRPAFNAYGLAKQLTWQTLRFRAEQAGLAVGRFVVPHPFGPLEKNGFTSQLASAWLAGAAADIRHPQLVRDFIHVDLLATAYARFCNEIVKGRQAGKLAPSGYVGSLAALAQLIASELQPRLGRPCAVRIADPPEPADEPLCRCNTDALGSLAAEWPFGRSWDRLAEFYSRLK